MNLTKVNCEKTLFTRRLLYIVVEEHSYYARAVGKGGKWGEFAPDRRFSLVNHLSDPFKNYPRVTVDVLG